MQLEKVIRDRALNRHDSLKLRGRLGFADSFLHGRLGSLVLKKLIDHAYSFTSTVDDELAQLLEFMLERLKKASPKKSDASTVKEEWSIFTDASYNMEEKVSGLGGVLVDSNGRCCSWFSLRLGPEVCEVLGTSCEDTIIYELELLAACAGLSLWADTFIASFPVLYGDNDSIRFAMIRGTAVGVVANAIMQQHLEIEVNFGSHVWFARVPTEANIADIPSRFLTHPLLEASCDWCSAAWECLENFVKKVKLECNRFLQKGERFQHVAPQVKKRRQPAWVDCLALHQQQQEHDGETFGTKSNCFGHAD